jgi:rod shape-determining protein MreC
MFSKKTIVIAGTIGLIALNIVVFSFHLILKSSLGDSATQAAFFFVSPVQAGIHSALDFTEGIWRHYFNLISVSHENDELRNTVSQLTQQNQVCAELEIANERLREYAGLKSRIPLKLIAAEVIAKDPSPWYQTLIVNKGQSSGVVEDCPVILSAGVVGHVVAVSLEYAKVLMIIDPNSSIDALIQRTRERCIVEGMNQNTLKLNYVLRQTDVELGDIIISSGFDGIYPKGLPIGRVSKIVLETPGLFKEIEMEPFMDFSKLEEVMIILNPIDKDFSFETCGS